jgi:type VI secretion system protein ImpA
MLSPSSLESIANPVSAEEPSGPDLAYDPDFIELETLATPKPEQQFGDTIMPGEEPNWADVAEKAEAVLLRSKDFRVASTLLRALTHRNGLLGFAQGMEVLVSLTENFWPSLHPQLDADDNNDPTMRVNALAPLTDHDMIIRDLHQAKLGVASGTGPIKVEDIEAHFSKTFSSNVAPTYSIDQVQAGLAALLESDPKSIEAAEKCNDLVKRLQSAIDGHVGNQASVDFALLQAITYPLKQAAQSTKGAAIEVGEDGSEAEGGANFAGKSSAPGGLKSRDDAVKILSQVIAFLEKTEPGNPAPLLIKRAQRLIGMNFIDIINDLAPEALNSVENIAGRSNAS